MRGIGQSSNVRSPWPPSMLFDAGWHPTSHNVTRINPRGHRSARLICGLPLHHYSLHRSRSFGSFGSGQPTNSRIQAPARTGPCFRDAGARGKFLIFRRNLVPRRERTRSRVRFIGKPGRAVSGNPAVAGTSRSRPTIWISRHYTRRHSEFLHKQMNLQCTRCAKNACRCKALGAFGRGPAPWHGSCQTGPNQ